MQHSLKLPMTFDAHRLRADLNQILADEYVPHFNTQYYQGDWSVVPLRSIGGVANQIYPDPTKTDQYADTPLLARCPYVRDRHRTVDPTLEPVSTGHDHTVACLLPTETRRSLWAQLQAGSTPDEALGTLGAAASGGGS